MTTSRARGASQNRLVIRYGQTLGGIDILDVHTNTLREHGKVLFAKIGKPLGHARITEINDSRRTGQRTIAYLVSSGGKERRVHEVTIESASRNWIPAYQDIAPPFYKGGHIREITRCWLVLTSIKERPPFRRREFRTLSGGDLSESLNTSTAGVFVVQPY